MKIGILTSSRADYGIYLPLLRKLEIDPYFKTEIIAFGTHLSESHGYTLNHIKNDGFKTIHTVSSLGDDDSQYGIAASYGNTVLKFAAFWKANIYDLVFCLGDRFEMSAAVQASIPYGVFLAHIHGGETTLGAIDNIYRHQLTLASKLHFVATLAYKVKVEQLTENSNLVFNVGALSLDGIKKFKPLDKQELFSAFNVKDQPFALVTFHPETVAVERNREFASQMRLALEALTVLLQIVVTMPNADTLGGVYRKELMKLKEHVPDKVVLVENFGKQNYFTAMHYCRLLLGNTSSGIIEAASFKKYVVNVGKRQKGRAQSENTFDVDFNAEHIVNKVKTIMELPVFKGENVYYKAGTAEGIIQTIKTYDKL
ncbi:UDP-N-acetylglucosamine 2-epimerase [uncultured Winogradskyella sp.]|uniref:UDP-N-acetylglucosamine 2-epimerase n=1 Tax=uncultured Winogradskyella sp. TaxID=395353 RepID=UPI002613BB85|nr:UDP-N-acetylglucosamine 2-epimerase [uncultured Winogradskyella sp.]